MVRGRRNRIKKLGKSTGQTAPNWGQWGVGEGKNQGLQSLVLSVFHISVPLRHHSNVQFVCFVDGSGILFSNEEIESLNNFANTEVQIRALSPSLANGWIL